MERCRAGSRTAFSSPRKRAAVCIESCLACGDVSQSDHTVRGGFEPFGENAELADDRQVAKHPENENTQMRAQNADAWGRELALIVASWPTLPNPLKAAILGIVASQAADLRLGEGNGRQGDRCPTGGQSEVKGIMPLPGAGGGALQMSQTQTAQVPEGTEPKRRGATVEPPQSFTEAPLCPPDRAETASECKTGVKLPRAKGSDAQRPHQPHAERAAVGGGASLPCYI